MPCHTERKVSRIKDKHHTAATTPRPFPLPLMRAAEFRCDVLDAVEAVTVSEAWWTNMYKPSTATPTYELTSDGANDVVTVDTGVVAVMVNRPPVIVCPPMVQVPLTVPMSPSGMIFPQPPVGVKTEFGSVE